MTAKQKRPILAEVPIIEVDQRLEQGLQHAQFCLMRKERLSGQIQTIPGKIVRPLVELKNGEFVTWLDGYAGGGDYIVEVRDTETAQELVPRFRLSLPGNPKDPRRNPTAGIYSNEPGMFMPPAAGGMGGTPAAAMGLPTPQMIAPGQINLPPQDDLPNWARAYPAQQQWALFYEKKGAPPNAGGSIQSDAMAMGFNNQLQSQLSAERADAAKLTEKLTNQEKTHRMEVERLSKELAEIKISAARAQSDAQLHGLQAQIAALRDTPKEQSKTDWAAILPALGPVFMTWLKNSQDSSLAQLKLNQDNTGTMLAAMHKKEPQTDWVKLLVGASPMLLEFFKSTGPLAKAEANLGMEEMRMMQIKMVMESMQQMQGSEPPAWYPLVQSVLESIGDVANTRSMAPAAPKQLPATQGVAVAQPASPEAEQVWNQLANLNAEAAQLTKLVWENLPNELGFHTHEWRMLIFNIHSRLLPVELAAELVTHLEQCRKFSLIPGPLRAIFEQPREAITEVIANLPIWKVDQEYSQLLIEAVVGEFERRNIITVPGASPVPPSSMVTPAPTEGGTVIDIIEATADGAEEDMDEDGAEQDETTHIDEADGTETAPKKAMWT